MSRSCAASAASAAALHGGTGNITPSAASHCLTAAALHGPTVTSGADARNAGSCSSRAILVIFLGSSKPGHRDLLSALVSSGRCVARNKSRSLRCQLLLVAASSSSLAARQCGGGPLPSLGSAACGYMWSTILKLCF